MIHLSFVDILFFFLRLLGAALICSSLFLYEDQEGQFQNKVEEWWIRLNEQEKVSRSKIATFIRGVADLTGRGFDRLFGPRLLSIRVIPVSIFLSFSSLFLIIVLTYTFQQDPHTGITRNEALFWFIVCLILALVPALVTNKWLLWLWWTIIPGTLLSGAGFFALLIKKVGLRSTVRSVALVLLVLVCSLAVDLFYIILTRWILRRITNIDRIPEIVLMLVLNLLALSVPLLGPICLSFIVLKNHPQLGAVVFFSILLNLFDVLAGLAGLLVALLLLVHRLFWPILERPLYAIQRFAPIDNKGWLFATGVALLIMPRHLSVDDLKTIIEKLKP